MGEETFVNGVRETVFALARLQDIEDTLRRIRADLERIPARKTEIENTLESAQKALAAARQDLDSAVKERRSLEQDIEACEATWTGLGAPSFERGVLAPLEKSIWQFNQWWIERMHGA